MWHAAKKLKQSLRSAGAAKTRTETCEIVEEKQKLLDIRERKENAREVGKPIDENSACVEVGTTHKHLRRGDKSNNFKNYFSSNDITCEENSTEENIDDGSTKDQLVEKDVLMPVKHNVFLWNLPDVEEAEYLPR
ncbi:hypothetical protein TNCV_1641311 [Trichonephila clavipes]|nr:hypothetical protein TNCV_1641311 [Trichonephila clavipes]